MSVPARRVEIAPRETRRISYVADYFQLGAYFGAAAVVGNLAAAGLGVDAARAALSDRPGRWVLLTVTIAGWWWTGHRLHARRRDGGWMAVATLAAPLVGWLTGAGGVGLSTLAMSAVGAAIVVSRWRELR